MSGERTRSVWACNSLTHRQICMKKYSRFRNIDLEGMRRQKMARRDGLRERVDGKERREQEQGQKSKKSNREKARDAGQHEWVTFSPESMEWDSQTPSQTGIPEVAQYGNHAAAVVTSS
ncbi:hypothetical protein BO71DRAFT_408519 [Aspergillus ellipticus CBS 707.79]|uniref:Uncharacterized protein n=1 Tax=Aspergillus ellipticus CBS 707.79 TaxID=1448320 RepID=A0A319DE92_9EURO|nr:hypothetical protein BO71DRAFT_408519 [Aspergillus ellipticus CBS 707.79]